MILARIGVDAPLTLWAVDLAGAPGPGEIATLCDAEQARAQRFKFQRDRRRYLAAHVALRQILGEVCGVRPLAQRFETGPWGKPVLAGHPQTGFSLSYAGDMALVGVADAADIGVDAEPLREVIGLEALCDDLFVLAERAEIAAAKAGPLRDSAFLRCWTRKEACIKAIGTGLSTAPASFECGADSGARTVSLETGSGPTTIEIGSFDFGDKLFAAWARAA
jgi:4'-phosphopantetheinyl transferase